MTFVKLLELKLKVSTLTTVDVDSAINASVGFVQSQKKRQKSVMVQTPMAPTVAKSHSAHNGRCG